MTGEDSEDDSETNSPKKEEAFHDIDILGFTRRQRRSGTFWSSRCRSSYGRSVSRSRRRSSYGRSVSQRRSSYGRKSSQRKSNSFRRSYISRFKIAPYQQWIWSTFRNFQ